METVPKRSRSVLFGSLFGSLAASAWTYVRSIHSPSLGTVSVIALSAWLGLITLLMTLLGAWALARWKTASLRPRYAKAAWHYAVSTGAIMAVCSGAALASPIDLNLKSIERLAYFTMISLVVFVPLCLIGGLVWGGAIQNHFES